MIKNTTDEETTKNPGRADQQDNDLMYKIDMEHRTRLVDFDFQTVKQRDQSLLAISGGTLALSTNLVSLLFTDPVYDWLVILSWGLFVLTILVTIISFSCSSKATRKEIDQIDRAYDPNRQGVNYPADKEKNRWSNLTELITILSITFFISAWITLVVFVSINLNNN